MHIGPQLFLMDTRQPFQSGERQQGTVVQQQALRVVVPHQPVVALDGFRPSVFGQILLDQFDGFLSVLLARLDGVACGIDTLAVLGIGAEAVLAGAKVHDNLLHSPCIFIIN